VWYSGVGEQVHQPTAVILISFVANHLLKILANTMHVCEIKKESVKALFFYFRFAGMFYFALLTNIFSFILFGIDKRKAIKHQRRISEFTLLSVTFLGGTVGALLGMAVFRHKISKRNFLLKFGFLVLIQIAFFYLIRNTFKNIE
jgi:uncharacterized membrane protein YsdA (DUF1294 family)